MKKLAKGIVYGAIGVGLFFAGMIAYPIISFAKAYQPCDDTDWEYETDDLRLRVFGAKNPKDDFPYMAVVSKKENQ